MDLKPSGNLVDAELTFSVDDPIFDSGFRSKAQASNTKETHFK
jgi:hypothetical protein